MTVHKIRPTTQNKHHTHFLKSKVERLKGIIIDVITQQEILLNCDQCNAPFARIILSYILISAFSFLSTCIRDLACF